MQQEEEGEQKTKNKKMGGKGKERRPQPPVGPSVASLCHP